MTGFRASLESGAAGMSIIITHKDILWTKRSVFNAKITGLFCIIFCVPSNEIGSMNGLTGPLEAYQ
jgi:hypothetical protein